MCKNFTNISVPADENHNLEHASVMKSLQRILYDWYETVKFKDLMAVNVKTTVFWVVMPRYLPLVVCHDISSTHRSVH